MKKTKEEILISAANLFFSKGFEATTTADISKAVGLCNSGLFSHFKSKEEIYRKVVEVFFLNKQDPNLKFEKTEGSLSEFIDLYIEGLTKSMKSLQTINTSNVTSADYLIFMLVARKKYNDFAVSYLEQDKLLFSIWKNKLQLAVNTGEVKKDIDVNVFANMFVFAFYGHSFIAAFDKGLNPQYLKEIYYGYYELIKSRK